MLDQVQIFLYSILIGIFFGTIYDLLRISRLLICTQFSTKLQEKIKNKTLPLIKKEITIKVLSQKREKAVIFIWDLLFFLIISPMSAMFVHAINNGKPRWFIFGGFFIGFVVYYFTIGKIVRFISEYLLFYLKLILFYVINLVKIPFNKLLKKIKCWHIKIISKINNIRKKKREKKLAEKHKKRKMVLLNYGKMQTIE